MQSITINGLATSSLCRKDAAIIGLELKESPHHQRVPAHLCSYRDTFSVLAKLFYFSFSPTSLLDFTLLACDKTAALLCDFGRGWSKRLVTSFPPHSFQAPGFLACSSTPHAETGIHSRVFGSFGVLQPPNAKKLPDVTQVDPTASTRPRTTSREA